MRNIEAADVRVGDTIRVTGQFTVTEVKQGLHGPVFTHTDDQGNEWDFAPSTSTRTITLLERDIRVPAHAEVATWASESGDLRTAIYDKDTGWESVSGIGAWQENGHFESFLRTNAKDVQFYGEIK